MAASIVRSWSRDRPTLAATSASLQSATMRSTTVPRFWSTASSGLGAARTAATRIASAPIGTESIAKVKAGNAAAASPNAQATKRKSAEIGARSMHMTAPPLRLRIPQTAENYTKAGKKQNAPVGIRDAPRGPCKGAS